MKKMSRLLLVLLALAMVASACGNDDGGSATTASGADLGLISPGKLIACSDIPYIPFEFEEGGTYTGFDVDTLTAIGATMGLTVEFKVTPFDGIWLQPEAGNCDMVASAMTITPERAQNALFSDPYFDADQSLLVRKADESLKLADLAGKVIGVQTGTTGEIYAQENAPEGATLQSFDEPAAMFLALQSGQIDAILQDLPVNGYRSTQDDQFVVSETFPTGEQYGFSVKTGDQVLVDAINSGLKQIRDDGEYDTIFAKWFGA